MEDKRKISLPVMFEKIEDLASDNTDERITKVKIFLMHLGLNFNGCIFNKEVVDEAIPSLAYCPIVGFLEKDKSTGENDFSDHRFILVKDDKGVRQKYKGSAYGVILSEDENNAHYEDKICDDGETRTFLVVDGIMWNMFEDSTEIMKRDTVKSQSMELLQDNEDSYDGYEDENGNFVMTRFSFRASCILGNSYEPAMINSTVEVVNFTMNDFVKDIQNEICNKYSLFTKMMNEQKSKIGGKNEMPTGNFSVMSQFNDIANIVKDFEKVKNRWGEEVERYSLVDIQDNEVIVTDRADNWNYYGLEYSMDGDKPVINFEAATRKKIVFENYSEDVKAPENAFNFGDCISDIENVAFEKITEIENAKTSIEAERDEAISAKDTAETNYNTIKAELDELKPKYEQFVAAEQQRTEAELNTKRDEMLAQFESALSDNEDFIEIKNNKTSYSVDDIETKCSVLLFRNNKGVNFSKDIKNAVCGVPDTQDNDDEQGYVATKYGNIPVNR